MDEEGGGEDGVRVNNDVLLPAAAAVNDINDINNIEIYLIDFGEATIKVNNSK